MRLLSYFIVFMSVLMLMLSCGNSSKGKGKIDNPFADNPSRDVTVSSLTVHEGQMYISADENSTYTLHIPVTLAGSAGQIAPDLEIKAAGYDGIAQAPLTQSAPVTINSASKEITLPLNTAYAMPLADATALVFNYRFSWSDNELKGKLSLFNIMPRIQTQLLGSAKLLEGDKSRYRVLLTDRQAGDPIMNAPVTLTAKLGEEIIATATGTTDKYGSADIEISVPADLSGSTIVTASVQTRMGTQEVQGTVMCERFAKILLTTDKPVYQPGQTIFMRTLSLKVPHKKPLAEQDVTLELLDPKGTKVFKQTGKTSLHGIYGTSFKLAKLVTLGHYKLRATVGGEKPVFEEKEILVDHYVLPKFSIGFEADREFYLPGEQVAAKVSSIYFYGKPVSGGTVKISAKTFDIEYNEFQTIDGSLDENGAYAFSLKLPNYFTGSQLEQGNAFVQLDISITDNANHEQQTSKKLLVVQNPVRITLVPESGRILPGIKQKFFLLLSDAVGRPMAGICSLSTGTSTLEIPVPILGIAVFEYQPTGTETSFAVQYQPENGATITKEFNFTAAPAHSFVIISPLKSIFEAGDTLPFVILAANNPLIPDPALIPDRVYVDVIQNGQVRMMKTVDLEKGFAATDITLDETMTGPIELMAYFLTESGDIIRDKRTVFVRGAANIAVEMKADKEQYRPRDTANLTFSVKDKEGNPAPSALGLAIVDEAVFAITEMKPGLENTYFEIEAAIMNPDYAIYGISPSDITSKTPETEEEETALDERAGAFFSAEGDAAGHGLAIDNYKGVESQNRTKAAAALQKLLQEKILKDLIKKDWGTYDCTKISFTTEDLVAMFDSVENADLWGNKIVGELVKESYQALAKITSAGPDEIAKTDDDITLSITICNPGWDAAEDGNGAGGRADAVVSADVASQPDTGTPANDSDAGAPSTTNKVRDWFPETLYVNPEIITNEQGEAQVTLTMPDSITAWRVTMMASTLGGALGSNLGAIKVFQDFFIDIDFPEHLTQFDEVKVPVGIYNYLSVAQRITLTPEPADWYELIGGTSVEVELPANTVGGTYFPIKVKKIGEHALTIAANGSTLSDTVKRPIRVIPAGVAASSVKSDILAKDATVQLTIPDTAVEGSEELFVKIYPGLMSQAIEGLDSILQMPYGCFEQTSSATYPNVMVLSYLTKTGQITPEIELKARGFITQGYQSLLTFEVEGGGFEWFGEKPAHTVLTCYGLMEFVDMAKVHEVDPAVISRTASWLAAQQDSDGSLAPSSGGIPEGAINNFQNSTLRTTAYAVWALSRAEKESEAVNKGAGYLLANLDKAEDTYSRAIVAMALTAAGKGSNPAVAAFLQKLMDEAQTDGNGGVFWNAEEKTEFYSDGNNAKIETTALIGLLLLDQNAYPDLVSGILTWLSRNKDNFGNWSTTQGTVLALRLMVESLDKLAGDPAEATITVSANNGQTTTIDVDASNSDVLRLVDLTPFVAKGVNIINIGFIGTGSLQYSTVAQWYEPAQAAQAKGPIDITVAYDKTTLEIDDTVGVTVTMKNTSAQNLSVILASLGLPPGFDLISDKLDTELAKENSALQKYEATPRRLTLYVRHIPANGTVTFKYDLIARYPVKANTGESSVNPYYEPDRKTKKEGSTLTINE